MPASSRHRRTDILVCRMVSTRSAYRVSEACGGGPPPISPRNDTDLRFVFARLRELVPAGLPATLRLAHIRSADGWCRRRKTNFEITVSRYMSRCEAVDVLLHEWAHAVAWSHLDDALGKNPAVTKAELEYSSHGPAWGVAFSRIYQTYVADIMGDLPSRGPKLPFEDWK